MATEQRVKNPAEILRDASPESAEAFRALRSAVENAGPLSGAQRELIVSAGFALLGQQGGFNTHARRALDNGASVEELRHAVLVTLAATATFGRVTDALGWIEAINTK